MFEKHNTSEVDGWDQNRNENVRVGTDLMSGICLQGSLVWMEGRSFPMQVVSVWNGQESSYEIGLNG